MQANLRIVIVVLNNEELIIITHPLVLKNYQRRSGHNNQLFPPEYCAKYFRLIYSSDLCDIGFCPGKAVNLEIRPVCIYCIVHL